MSGLLQNTKYHYRIKLVNSKGTFYGSDFEFLTNNDVWTRQLSTTTSNLKAVYFVNSKIGYVGGDLGTLLKTIDGGKNWLTLNFGSTEQLTGIFFLNADTGFVSTLDGSLSTTFDGGNNWTTNRITYNEIFSIFFISPTNGWIGGTSKVYRTSNGGNSWSSSNSVSMNSTPIYSVAFYDLKNGFASGNFTSMLYSSDGGVKWYGSATNPQAIGLKSVCITPDTTGYSCGNYGRIYKRTFNATQWDSLNSGVENSLNSIFFTDNNNGYSVGSDGVILKTTDKGIHWAKSLFGASENLNAIFFTDQNCGWAVGNGGRIIHTQTGGEICTNIEVLEQPKSTLTCADEQVTFSVSVAGPAPLYQWMKNGIEIPDACKDRLTLNNVTVSDSGKYSCKITNPCSTINSEIATLFVKQKPTTPIASNNGPICIGSELRLMATTVTDAKYYWHGPNNFESTLQNPIVCKSVTIDNVGEYFVTAFTDGCFSDIGSTNVRMNPMPSILSVSPINSTLCEGSQILTVNGGIINSKPLSELFNNTTSSFSTSSVSGTINATQNTNYYSEGGSSFLLSTTSSNADVYFTMDKAVDLSGTNNALFSFSHICATEKGYDFGYVQYSIDNGLTWADFPAASYLGSAVLKNGVVCFDKSSYTDWNNQFSASYSTPGGAPATTLWKTESINIPNNAITSTQFKIRFMITTDNSTNYYGWLIDNIALTANQQTSIIWYPKTGLYTDSAATIPYNGGNAATLFAKPISSTEYTIVSSSIFGCSDTVKTFITVNPKPETPIAGNNGPVCIGAELILTATNIPNALYIWSGPNGFKSTLQNPIVCSSATSEFAGTYYVTAISNGCKSSVSSTVASIIQTPTSLSITPSNISLCTGDIQLLVTNGAFINVIPLKEAFNNSTTLFSLSSVSGTCSAYRNTNYYSEGVSSYLFNANSVNAEAVYIMNTSIDLTGFQNPILSFSHICATEAGYDYGYIQYSTNNGLTWTNFPTACYSGSAILKKGVVCFDKSSYSDWSLQFTSSNSTPGITPASNLWKTENISIPSEALTSTQFKIRFRITTDSGTNYFGWLIDNVIISGKHQATITWSPISDLYLNNAATLPYTGGNASFVYSKPNSTITYLATTSSPGSCTISANSLISVISKPIKPTITQLGNILNSSSTVGNQWYNQNGQIIGAINQSYTAVIDGTYYVVVSLNGCTSESSNQINVKISGLNEGKSKEFVEIFPNPAKNELNIFINENTEKLGLRIYNSIGKIVREGYIYKKMTINISDLIEGVYLISFENGKSIKFEKIVK